MYAQALAGVAALSALSMASPVPDKTVHSHPDVVRTGQVSEETDVDLNWAGSIIYPPSGTSFTSAVGTFVVPGCSNPNDGSAGPWASSFWVGIDGTSGSNDILQSGATCQANTDGSQQFHAWVEYFPAGEVAIDGFNVNAGDEITITINVDSSTSGTIIVADNTSGQTTTTSLTAPTPTATIVGISAEWIVEDFSSSGGLVPFANFGQVAWTGASAVASDGNTYSATEDGFETILIENSAGNTITSVTANGDDALTVAYTG